MINHHVKCRARNGRARTSTCSSVRSPTPRAGHRRATRRRRGDGHRAGGPLLHQPPGDLPAPQGARARVAHHPKPARQVAERATLPDVARQRGDLALAVGAALGRALRPARRPPRSTRRQSSRQPPPRPRQTRKAAMTTTTAPQLTLSRIFDAPRALVYRAFTDPDQFAAWWGPIGNSLPRDEIEFDVRPGGYRRWRRSFRPNPAFGTTRQPRPHRRRRRRAARWRHARHRPAARGLRALRDEDPDRVPRRGRRTDATRDPPVAPGASGCPSEEGWREALSKLDAMLVCLSVAG